MGKSCFKDSLKTLEADIQHANTLALDCSREKDGSRLQFRLCFNPAVHLFHFLLQWADCGFASALGLLRIVVYLNYPGGKTTMSVYERRATVKQFYAVIFPSLMQLQRGITDSEDEKQKEICATRYRKGEKLSEIDAEREEECGICLETTSKVVLPDCNHALCLDCYRDWHGRSQSCPFCRDGLKRVNSGDLWFCTEKNDVVDLALIFRENCKRLFMYIDRLPLIVPNNVVVPYVYDLLLR